MEGKEGKREEKNGEVNCYSVATVPLQGGAERHYSISSMCKYSVSVMYSVSGNEEQRHHCQATAFEMVNEICERERGGHHLLFSSGGVNI